MIKPTFLFLIALTMISSCKAPEWPTKKFIKKYKYEEVKGMSYLNPTGFEFCSQKTNPFYPNGQMGINMHLRENIVYPLEALKGKISGTVILSYVIGTDGRVAEITVESGVDPSLDNEAIRVLKCMKRWIPGSCNGEFVRVQFYQPVKFSIR